jgi:putative nucleotidyltransferase with HDIG domain
MMPLKIDAALNLPALPAAVADLLDMLGRDDVEIGALAAKIALDPALAAKTLRLANSSFYGMGRHVSSLTEAASVLGLRTVNTVVTTAALTGSFASAQCEGFDFNAFWRHAVGTAVSAKLVAAAGGADAQAAFIAGLLHDIGRLVIAVGFPQRYAEVLAQGHARGLDLGERERSLLGVDHAMVGALVAEHWRFPKAIAEAIAGHHAPLARTAPLALANVVHLADRLVHAVDHEMSGQSEVPVAFADAWVDVGLPPDRCTPVFAQAQEQTAAICVALLG